MSQRRRRPLTGIVVTPNEGSPSSKITFRADLLRPPQSQVVQYADLVAERIAQLDLHAQKLAEGFGISFTDFVLNPRTQLPLHDNVAMLAFTLESFTRREERVSLERRGGRWGLYFTRSPSAFDRERTTEAVALKDAPLDVRERFLERSESFFREYVKMCEGRLGQMKSSVNAADRTLALLTSMQLV